MRFNKNYLFVFLIAIFSFSINFHYANIGVMPNDGFVLYNGGIFKYGDDMVSTGMTKLNVHVEDDSFPR